MTSLEKSFKEAQVKDGEKWRRDAEVKAKESEDLAKRRKDADIIKWSGYHKPAALTAVMLRSKPINSKPQFVFLWSLLKVDKLPLFERFYKKVLPPQPKLISLEKHKENLENEKRCTSCFPTDIVYNEWKASYRQMYGTQMSLPE